MNETYRHLGGQESDRHEADRTSRTHYRTLSGRACDLGHLSQKEHRALVAVAELYGELASTACETEGCWELFARRWRGLVEARLGGSFSSASPLWAVGFDLEMRLGLAADRVAPPDYRDHLADLIEDRFESRYEFCKLAGVDEGHLSRVIAGNKHFSISTLERLLVVLDGRLDLGCRHGDPVATLRALNHRLDLLEAYRGEARRQVLAKAAVRFAGLHPDDAEGLRRHLRAGRPAIAALDSVLADRRRDRVALLEEIVAEGRERLEEATAREVGAPAISVGLSGAPIPTEQSATLRDKLYQFGFRKPDKVRYPGRCCFLFIPRKYAGEAILARMKHLIREPSVIEAGIPDYGSVIDGGISDYSWLALKRSPETRSQGEQIARFLEEIGGVYRDTEAQARSFVRKTEDQRGKIRRLDPVKVLGSHLGDEEIVRLVFQRDKVSRPTVARLCEHVGLCYSIRHACVIDHGFCDFVPLDPKTARAVPAGDRRVVRLTELATDFGAEASHVLRGPRDFRRSLQQDIDRLMSGEIEQQLFDRWQAGAGRLEDDDWEEALLEIQRPGRIQYAKAQW